MLFNKQDIQRNQHPQPANISERQKKKKKKNPWNAQKLTKHGHQYLNSKLFHDASPHQVSGRYLKSRKS